LVALVGLLAMTAVSQAFSSLTAFTTLTLLVGYMILYRALMDTVGIPTTALTVEMLAPEQVPMGQGLVGVTRSIGASFGITVTSVFFERRYTWHQHQAYANYDHASPLHEASLHDLRLTLHSAGVESTSVESEMLKAIHQHMDTEAIAVSFQESFLFICLCFLLALIPMLCLLSRRLGLKTPES
jgi:DHA2 family multidrug resistance protein